MLPVFYGYSGEATQTEQRDFPGTSQCVCFQSRFGAAGDHDAMSQQAAWSGQTQKVDSGAGALENGRGAGPCSMGEEESFATWEVGCVFCRQFAPLKSSHTHGSLTHKSTGCLALKIRIHFYSKDLKESWNQFTRAVFSSVN